MSRILLFCVIVFCSCQKEGDEADRLPEFLKSYPKREFDNLLFLYLDGCTSCQEFQEQLYKEALLNNSYQIFLVTNSPKKARLMFGLLPAEKVFFDTELKALDFGLIVGFPIVYHKNQTGKYSRFEISLDQVHLGLP
jgi:hypothetical protein